MIGKLLCRLDLHKWRYDGREPIPKFCARCGWGPMKAIEVFKEPEESITRDRQFIRCAVLINIYAPALASEFRRLWTAPLDEVADWLDQNFPLKEGRWGCRSIAWLYRDLKAQMDGKL